MSNNLQIFIKTFEEEETCIGYAVGYAHMQGAARHTHSGLFYYPSEEHPFTPIQNYVIPNP